MTDALKAAVREAMHDCTYRSVEDNVVDEFTSALARRGVVVATGDTPIRDVEEERRLGSEIDDIVQSGRPFVEIAREVRALILESATVAERDAHVVTDQNVVANSIAAGESPAPKPARKVVQIVCAERGIAALMSDSTIWAYDPHCGWIKIPSIPQPGEEQ